jgi:hypothetical protein
VESAAFFEWVDISLCDGVHNRLVSAAVWMGAAGLITYFGTL